MIFIRPWFLIFLLLPLLLWLFKGKLAASAVLSKYVDERLLPFVTVHFGGGVQNKRPWLFAAVWTALVLAGAGPAYEKISVPVKISAPAHVIVMDMSPAMNGETLEAAKRKLYDLLGALKGHQAGLVVYDDKGYVVSPLTQDLNIIRTMIPGLGTNVMPTYGNRADLGFEKAAELFNNVGVKDGQIIFLTAGGFDADKLTAAAQKLPYDIAVIGFGSDEAKPIGLPNGGFLRSPDGSVVFADLDETALKKIGTYVKASVTDDDIHTALSAFSSGDNQGGKPDALNADVWRDLGPMVLIFTAPFFAFLFRRGTIYVWMFAVCSLALGYTHSAQASEWFLRPDQQEHRLLEEGVDAYHKGDYEAAKKAFESLHKTPNYSADALYNKGNALAYLNDIKGAIAAYDKALKINPNHAEAKYNKEYLQKQLPPEQQNQNDASQSGGGQSQDRPSDGNESENPNETGNNGQDGQQTDKSQNADETDTEDGQNSQSESSGQNNAQNASSQGETKGEDSGTQNQGAAESSQQNRQSQGSSQMTQEAAMHSSDSSVERGQNASVQSLPENSLNTPMEQPSATQNISSHEAEQSSDTLHSVPLDQESAQLLNRIRQDPSRLLRYRLYQQWRQQNE